MNDLTFGAALLALLVTFATAFVLEVSSPATSPSPQPPMATRQAPREQQLALATPVDCMKVAQASTAR